MIGKIDIISDDHKILQITLEGPCGYKPGDSIEIKKIRKSSLAFRKLQNLYFKFLDTLHNDTGYSVSWWHNTLKKENEFFITIKEPDGNHRYLKSVSHDECTCEELSAYFKNVFYYIEDKQIMDISKFKNDYYEITGKELI